MNRTAALAIVLCALVALALVWSRPPRSEPGLSCPPEGVRWIDSGSGFIAACADEGDALPANVAIAVGQKLSLNRSSAAELALIPGIGRVLGQTIVGSRGDGGFRSWAEVESVKGVGPAKLDILRRTTTLDR